MPGKEQYKWGQDVHTDKQPSEPHKIATGKKFHFLRVGRDQSILTAKKKKSFVQGNSRI